VVVVQHPSEQIYHYIMARTSYFLMRWCLLGAKSIHWNWLKVLAHWDSSLTLHVWLSSKFQVWTNLGLNHTPTITPPRWYIQIRITFRIKSDSISAMIYGAHTILYGRQTTTEAVWWQCIITLTLVDWWAETII
jgi:hypothetical protein